MLGRMLTVADVAAHLDISSRRAARICRGIRPAGRSRGVTEHELDWYMQRAAQQPFDSNGRQYSRRPAPRALQGLARRVPVPRPGVYFLCRGEEIVYVGQAVNVYARPYQHTDKDWDRAFFVPVWFADELADLEGALIRVLRPPLNRDCPGGWRVPAAQDDATLAEYGLQHLSPNLPPPRKEKSPGSKT